MFGLGTILPVVGGAFGLMLGGLGGGIKGADERILELPMTNIKIPHF